MSVNFKLILNSKWGIILQDSDDKTMVMTIYLSVCLVLCLSRISFETANWLLMKLQGLYLIFRSIGSVDRNVNGIK